MRYSISGQPDRSAVGGHLTTGPCGQYAGSRLGPSRSRDIDAAAIGLQFSVVYHRLAVHRDRPAVRLSHARGSQRDGSGCVGRRRIVRLPGDQFNPAVPALRGVGLHQPVLIDDESGHGDVPAVRREAANVQNFS